ncbi:MAG: LytR family transcriptional regulator, partial [Actinobacteria bacterium]|nr:LytR family transcriptional regulator [Actinomycetota bacterium]
RNGLGERADTIMILRLDPTTNAGAVLSFPRDLWVKIAGKKSRSRINSAFNRDDPNTLVLTIWENFGIPVDHYVNVDFCAFKKIVDAVGGVRVPFATPIRDRNTGLNIENAGCHRFDGEEGLAYVRSRKLFYYDNDSQSWKQDPAADRGRISRQQDFLRRALQKALDVGAGSPTVAKDLIDAALEFVILDDQLTPGKLLELAQAMRNLDPATLKTYQVEGLGKLINGQSVIEPKLETDTMQSVLAVFQGEARLVDAPEQLVEVPAPETSAPTTTTRSTGSSTTAVSGTTTTLPPVFVESNSVGVLPTDDPACR